MSTFKVGKPVSKSIELKFGSDYINRNSTTSYIFDNLGYAEWQVKCNGSTLTLQPEKLLKTKFTLEKVDFKYYTSNSPSQKYSLTSTTIDVHNKIFTGYENNGYINNGYNLYFDCLIKISELEIDTGTKISNDYEKLLIDATFSDVAIKTNSENQILKVHKNILAARSPVFAAMFSNDMKENQTNEIKITDVDPDVLKDMLLFMYCGKISNYENCYDLFVAADKYQIDDLQNCIHQYLLKNINDKTIINCLKVTENYDKHEIRKIAMEFITRNYQKMKPVINSSEWLDLISEYPVLMKDIMVAFYQKLT